MKLHIISDTHLEMHRDHGASFFRGLDAKNIDILILSGDITVLRDYYWAKDALSEFCAIYKDVIYVCGNHEYYGTDIGTCDHHLGAIEIGLSNLHVLRLGQSKIVNGQRFTGGTLWFPDHPSNRRFESHLNDFRVIQGGFKTWVYDQNRQTIENLTKNMQADDILVTHHLPSNKSVDPKFYISDLNRFFVCNIENLILDKKPKLAIHGHSHCPVDYKIASTRIYSNPLGYPNEGENPNFLNRMLLEII